MKVHEFGVVSQMKKFYGMYYRFRKIATGAAVGLSIAHDLFISSELIVR